MTAKEYLLETEEYKNQISDAFEIHFDEVAKLMEAYHRAKVESVTDEIIQKRSGVNVCYVDDKDNDESQGFYEGCKWVLFKLLKQ